MGNLTNRVSKLLSYNIFTCNWQIKRCQSYFIWKQDFSQEWLKGCQNWLEIKKNYAQIVYLQDIANDK